MKLKTLNLLTNLQQELMERSNKSDKLEDIISLMEQSIIVGKVIELIINEEGIELDEQKNNK